MKSLTHFQIHVEYQVGCNYVHSDDVHKNKKLNCKMNRIFFSSFSFVSQNTHKKNKKTLFWGMLRILRLGNSLNHAFIMNEIVTSTKNQF